MAPVPRTCELRAALLSMEEVRQSIYRRARPVQRAGERSGSGRRGTPVCALIGVVRVCEHTAGRSGLTEHFLQPPRLLFHANPAKLENLSHELARRLARKRAVRIFLLHCLNMLHGCSQYDPMPP